MIAHHDGAGRDDRIGAERDALADDRARTDVTTGANADVSANHRAGCYVSEIAECHVVLDDCACIHDAADGDDGTDGSGETVEAGAHAPTTKMAAVRTARGRRR